MSENFIFIDKNHLIPLKLTFTKKIDAMWHYFDRVNTKNNFIKNITLLELNNNEINKVYYYNEKKHDFYVIYNNGKEYKFDFDVKVFNINGEILIDKTRDVLINIQNTSDIKNNTAIEYKNIAESFLSFDPTPKNNNIITPNIKNKELNNKKSNEENNKKSNEENNKKSNEENKNNKQKNMNVQISEENNETKEIFDDIIIINDDFDINNYKNIQKENINDSMKNATQKEINEEIKEHVEINSDNIEHNINNIDNNISDKINNCSDEEKKELIHKTITNLSEEFYLLKKKNKTAGEKIATLNKKLEKLEIERKTNLFSDLRKMKNEYLQFKKIKFIAPDFTEPKNSDNISIPNVFTKKYNFINKACENDRIKQLFEELLCVDVEGLFYSLDLDTVNKNILLLSDSYAKLKKDLHLKFDSDYNYLEDEITIQNNTI